MRRLPPVETPILLVDDSPAILARMRIYLERLGFQNVRSASDLAGALERFRESRPTIVFLDLVVGEERGVDFAATALDEDPDVEIILMTALSVSDPQVVSAIAEGARDLISKPIQLEHVEAALVRVGESLLGDKPAVHEDAGYV